MSDEFNARAARSKRPCPIWIDAFQRDTQHLEADEIGGYFLILMAMWSSEDCSFPNDERRLARVCRVSTRLWRSRIGPVLMPFFKVSDGKLISNRLREEATYTERQVTQQSSRKKGQKHAKPLNNIEPSKSVDRSADDPRDYPTQLPNYPTVDDYHHQQESDDDQEFYDRVLTAAKIDISRDVTGRWFRYDNRHEVERWQTDLDLTKPEIIEVVRDVSRRRTSPPGSMRYFQQAMQDRASTKRQPKLSPTKPQSMPHLAASPERFAAIMERYGT